MNIDFHGVTRIAITDIRTFDHNGGQFSACTLVVRTADGQMQSIGLYAEDRGSLTIMCAEGIGDHMFGIKQGEPK